MQDTHPSGAFCQVRKDEPSFARNTLFLLLAFILGAQLPEVIG